MGNCMETRTLTQETGDMQIKQQQQEEIEGWNELAKGDERGKSCLRLKVVLTREELKRLILQLNQKEGKGQGLNQILEEIERSRAKAEEWKPSLETILEVSELDA
ncbi:hypothetical protein L6164_028330 [Bauhinia variegata]|uniref:Uncharacterized protein n=1 Tax=Bauhinia variegata TaxID=167791 RepID=A0ACB9LXE4_BAUVA|nr:hypothetical protein L6164_028330 [Bauhinia variegata]